MTNDQTKIRLTKCEASVIQMVNADIIQMYNISC